MRTSRRRRGAPAATLPVRSALAATALLLCLPSTASAASGTSPGAVIGGPQLDTTGIVVAPTAPEPPSDLSAASWLVADLDTGQVLAAKNPHGQFAPASTLKTLTALALMPVVEPDQLVLPTYDDVAV